MLIIDNLNFVPAYTGNKAKNHFNPKAKECGIKGGYKREGVYFIKENGILVYIGMSMRCVKSQLYRHFQVWTDKRTKYQRETNPIDRVTYNDGRLERNEYTVAVVYTDNSERASDLEKQLIRFYKPRDNYTKYAAYEAQEDLSELLKEIQSLPDNKIENNAITISGIVF